MGDSSDSHHARYNYPLRCNVRAKVSAAYALTKSIAQHKPAMIINLGSAGSNTFSKGTIVCCTQFIQRDMDVRGLGFQLYETPLSGIDPVLQYGLQMVGLPQGICGTGDSFEMNHDVTAYTVVDMEAYPLALIAQKENIPFLCLKYISDGADGSAADDWNELVANGRGVPGAAKANSDALGVAAFATRTANARLLLEAIECVLHRIPLEMRSIWPK